MEKEQKKPKKQAKMPERKIQNIVLSENRSAKYKIVKIQQNAVIRKEKADTASTAVQSQKQDDKKPENMQKAANISGVSQRRISSASISNKTTTPENKKGDIYINTAKLNYAQKMLSSDKAAKTELNRGINDKNYRIQSDAQTQRLVSAFEKLGNSQANKAAINNRAEDTNYRVQNASIVQAIQRKSNNENEVKSYTSNNTQDMAKTSRYKAKAEEITAKMKADVNKMRSETSSLENRMRTFAISKAKDSKKIVHFKKGNVDSKRFNKAVNNTIKKEISNNPDFKKFKGKAAVHYKKMNKLEKKQKKIDNKLEKAERKAERNEKILEAGKTAAAVLTNPKQAVKQFAEDKIRKTALGNSALNAKDDLQMLSKAAEADSLSEGTANVVMAMPEKHIKKTVKNTVTKTLTGKSKADGLAKKKKKVDRKYGAEAAKAGRAERKALQAKNSVIRKAKIRFFKEEKGLVKSQSIIKNIKNGIGRALAGVGKLALECGKSAIAAIIGSVGPMAILSLVIIAVISALFSWLMPHEETLYIDETNTWEPVMVETNEEILKGYIKHIQDYFDKKQLEILQVVDINFGGFAPDKYDYQKTEDKGGVLDFSDRPNLTTEYTEYYIEKTLYYQEKIGEIPGDRYNPGSIIWSEAKSISKEGMAIMRTEYYKFDNDLGYEIRTTSFDYDITRTYMRCAVDIEAYWNSQNKKEESGGSGSKTPDNDEPIYACENGKFSINQDITDEKMVLREKGAIIYEGSVLTYILSHPELFEHTVSVIVPGNDKYSRVVRTTSNWKNRTVTEIISDEQYVFNNYIWNLYEYGNQWIKLSDDCDYEHIIAMAAIKKWQEIEADGFDSNTYTFEITDEDLDYCLDNLYEFYYSYGPGRCRKNNCHKYYAGNPPTAHYTCNRATTHKHLMGQVANLELIGGIDFVLNKVLKIPIRADYSSDEEYTKAKSQFETDKDIYKIYAEFICSELGTSTKIPDYENDREAQYRLLRMYQAGHGKKPSNPPTNINVSVEKRIVVPNPEYHHWCDREEHFFLNISWTAPDPEEYAEGKYVKIDGYNVYAYNRSEGTKKLLAQVSGTSANDIDYGLGRGGERTTIEEDGNTLTLEFAGKTFTNIVVEAYNDGGKGPQSDPVYVLMN